MADPRAEIAVEFDKREARDVLREIDRPAGAPSFDSDRRVGDGSSKNAGATGGVQQRSSRRRITADCRIRYIGRDGRTVVTTHGLTRDISAQGLGFVAREWFTPDTPLQVLIDLLGDKGRQLTGKVSYSRRVREGWYLTDVRLEPADDSRLAPDAGGQAAAGAPFFDSNREVGDGSSENETEGDGTHHCPPPLSTTPPAGELPAVPVSAREQTLEMLARLATEARSIPKEKLLQVIKLSMSPDQPVRRATIAVFMRLSGQSGVLSLISMLDDVDPAVQGDAAAALGHLEAKQAIAPLRQLLQHKDDVVVLRAAEALSKMNDKSGLGVVTRVLRSKTDLNRRAARTLGIIVGRKFRPNTDGVAAARKYAKANKL